jgi:5-oxoprolinase (ATP-hydrolysing)
MKFNPKKLTSYFNFKNIQKPSNLYAKVIEVDCRIVPALSNCQMGKKNFSFNPTTFTNNQSSFPEHNWPERSGVAGSKYLSKSILDVNAIRKDLDEVHKSGLRSLAVVLAHSYACPDDELQIGQIAKDIGFAHITLSHQAMPMCRLVARGYTACAEAYLTPHVEKYLDSFKAGFKDKLAGVDVLFMQSDGGLTPMENFRGARAILSGPAGGVVG